MVETCELNTVSTVGNREPLHGFHGKLVYTTRFPRWKPGDPHNLGIFSKKMAFKAQPQEHDFHGGNFVYTHRSPPSQIFECDLPQKGVGNPLGNASVSFLTCWLGLHVEAMSPD